MLTLSERSESKGCRAGLPATGRPACLWQGFSAGGGCASGADLRLWRRTALLYIPKQSCRAGIRTPVFASRGRCPTARRPGSFVYEHSSILLSCCLPCPDFKNFSLFIASLLVVYDSTHTSFHGFLPLVYLHFPALCSTILCSTFIELPIYLVPLLMLFRTYT